VSDNDVAVYVNEQPQQLNIGFVVDPWDGSSDYRTISFFDAPAAGSKILISVRTASPYYISGNELIFKSGGGVIPLPGDIISVTTWNDTQQQDLLTQVFVGPTDTELGVPSVAQGYDDTLFDQATVTDTPGSFDFSTGLVIQTNQFDVGREIIDANRLIVTVNGLYMFENQGFTVDGSIVTISGPVISGSTVVAITSCTQSVLPGEMAFRIFQDMLGIQRAYRITPETSTVLAQPLSATADVIYLEDASKVSEPNLQQGIFGQITINGERITYRNRDVMANTVSGLRRGTAGTGAASHAVNSEIYDIGLGNLLPERYQNQIDRARFDGDDTTVTYTAADININDNVYLYQGGQIQVTVDGTVLNQSEYSVTSYDPVIVELVQTPARNSTVIIQVTQFDTTVDSQSFVASGFTRGFASTITVQLIAVPESEFQITGYTPLDITVAGVPIENTVYVLQLESPNPVASLLFLTNGISNVLATDIDIGRPVVVQVGGSTLDTDQYTVTSVSPVSVTLDIAPDSGIEIDVSVARGLSWYQPGINTASDGVALQETDTQAARFIRGEI
jgi:hypothetical protein